MKSVVFFVLFSKWRDEVLLLSRAALNRNSSTTRAADGHYENGNKENIWLSICLRQSTSTYSSVFPKPLWLCWESRLPVFELVGENQKSVCSACQRGTTASMALGLQKLLFSPGVKGHLRVETFSKNTQLEKIIERHTVHPWWSLRRSHVVVMACREHFTVTKRLYRRK